MVTIVEHIDLNEVYKALSHPAAGGTCVFVGTVRNHSEQQDVNALFFEAYNDMAIAEMEKIRKTAIDRWRLEEAVMVHAVGQKEVGDVVVAVGVAAAHRKEAFPACQYLIDELKKTVPIWKKEFFTDHTSWVSPTP